MVEPAADEVRSPARVFLFGGLSVVLAGAVGLDLTSGAPSAPQDVLYTLLAVGMLWTAVREREELL